MNLTGRQLKAFSLIELLVSIVIVAALAGLLIPTVTRVMERSREVRCVSNLRQIGLAISLYAADHKLELPPGDQPSGEWFKLNSSSWLLKYGADGAEQAAKGLLRCPGDRTGPPVTDYRYYYSYTWNSQLLQSYDANGLPAHDRLPVKVSDALRKILFADAVTNAEAPTQVPKYSASITTKNAKDRLSSRHRGGTNCLFGDGTVNWLPKDEAIKPIWLDRNDS